MKSFIHYLLIGIVFLLTITSCQEEDLGFSQDEIRASVYDRNFIKEYGEISPNQTWDFSTYTFDVEDLSHVENISHVLLMIMIGKM